MSNKGQRVEIMEVDRVELPVKAGPWSYADLHRDEIDEHFKRRQTEQTALWNGRVLLLREFAVRDRVLKGVCFESDYASLLAWRDWGFPDTTVYNFFAAAALRTVEGAYLVGEMAPHTAPAGQHFFPCGTPEPSDIDAGGHVDLFGSLRRELHEETGLNIGEFDVEPGWTLIRDRGYLGCIRRLQTRETADQLHARILSYLARQRHPEFSAIRIIHRRSDVDERIPYLFAAYLRTVLLR